MDKQKDIGALWEKTAKSGQSFMSGKIDFMGRSIEVVAFRNDKASPENKQPSWRIYLSTPKEDSEKVPF